MRVKAIVNSQAQGAAATIEPLAQAFRAHGIEAETRLVAPSDLAAAFEQAARGGADALVAGGGDGTVRSAAAVAVEADLVLGVLPLGTFNHFARDARIPLDLDAAVAVIAAGKERRVDVGEVNGRLFLNNSSVGLYPMMVRERDRQRRHLGRSKRLAMLVASLRALRHFGRHQLAIRLADREAPVETPLLFVGNNRYETRLTTLGGRERIDGGELCLYAPLVRSPLHFLGLALRGLVGRLDQQRDFIALDGMKDVAIAAHTPSLVVSTDGESERMETPLRYRIRPGALRLLSPRE
jgi:diacylglycerol kinase family enzyme